MQILKNRVSKTEILLDLYSRTGSDRALSTGGGGGEGGGVLFPKSFAQIA